MTKRKQYNSKFERVRNQFLQLDESGMDAPSIAKELGVTKRTVVRWRGQTDRLKSTKGNRPYGILPDEMVKTIRDMADDGCSKNEIVRSLGVHANTVTKYAPDAAWTIEQSNEYRQAIRSAIKQVNKTGVGHIVHEDRFRR
jgi:hypothetical protein